METAGEIEGRFVTITGIGATYSVEHMQSVESSA